jgi:RNA polymerase sigma-70 factor (ECF subfamily)
MGMSFPTQAEALSLHERLLQGDRVASAEVFEAFMDPILRVLTRARGCTREDAYDSAIDAVVSYVRNPERYDHHRGTLSTYLTQAARNRLMDRQRSLGARTRREQEFAIVFELQARSPKVAMEISSSRRERSTRRLAETLGLGPLPEMDLRRAVKRARDRLMKWLARLGKEEPDVES